VASTRRPLQSDAPTDTRTVAAPRAPSASTIQLAAPNGAMPVPVRARPIVASGGDWR